MRTPPSPVAPVAHGLARNPCLLGCPLGGAVTPHVKVKIILGFYLIATKIDEVYEVKLPPEVKRLLSFWSVGLSFGFNGVSTVLECVGLRGYLPTLAIYMVTPAVLTLLMFLLGLLHLSRRRSERTLAALFELTAPIGLKIIFLFYPLVTTVAFNAFSCYKFTESRWLKAE